MPNPSLLEGSGIQYGWGISVDERMRTSAEDVYAAGDLAETRDRLTGETYVHAIFPNAEEQGRVVGLNLPGYDTVYEGSDRINSLKHLGVLIMAVGLKEGDQILRDHRVGHLRTLYLGEDRLVGFPSVGDIQTTVFCAR